MLLHTCFLTPEYQHFFPSHWLLFSHMHQVKDKKSPHRKFVPNPQPSSQESDALITELSCQSRQFSDHRKQSIKLQFQGSSRVPRGSVVRRLTRNPGVLGSGALDPLGFFLGVSLGKTLQSPA